MTEGKATRHRCWSRRSASEEGRTRDRWSWMNATHSYNWRVVNDFVVDLQT